MSRLVILLLLLAPVWWVSCQTGGTPEVSEGAASSSSLISYPNPIEGVHSIEKPTTDLRIEITVEGLQVGTAKMVGVSGDQNYIIDTALVETGGRILFQRATTYPAGFYYVLLPDFTNLSMIIDANQRFSLRTRVGDLVNSMQVTDSKENDLLYENLKFQGPLDQQLKNLAAQQRNRAAGTPEHAAMQAQLDSLGRIRKEHLLGFARDYPKALFTKFKMAGQNPEVPQVFQPDGAINIPLQTFLYREAMWDNVDFTDIRLLRTPVVQNKLTRYIKELTVQSPDSIISATDRLLARVDPQSEYFKFFANFIPLAYRPGESTLMDAEAVQVHMVNNYFTSEKAFWATPDDLMKLQKQASEMEASLLGKVGPDVQARDTKGEMRSIYEMKSDYIVVFMWNPECSHCKEETPKLIELLREWKPKGLDVFGIAVNTTEAEFKRVARDYGMTWNNVFDPTNRAIYAKYYVDNTPEVYVLNPDRVIIGKNLKVGQISTVVERDIAKRKGQ